MCGIVGVWAPRGDAAALAYAGALSLQHRGQEAWGVVVTQAEGLVLTHALGRVRLPAGGPGEAAPVAVAHTRYSTAGASTLVNAQPLVWESGGHRIAVAHNGNITNASELRDTLRGAGYSFRSTSDSEVIVGLLATAAGDVVEAVEAAVAKLEGAYSVVAIVDEALVAFRDPHGFRPLAIGSADGVTVVASETCALDVLGCLGARQLEAGELVLVDAEGEWSYSLGARARERFCVFEYVYLARRDSRLGDEPVGAVRTRIGRELACEAPAAADFVVPVPASGTLAARGYADGSGLPLVEALVRNDYVGRTFIEPDPELRRLALRVKFNVLGDVDGARVVLVDDSIVRGSTMRQVIELLRARGAAEVHVRIGAPPLVAPCHFGVDIADAEQLIAARHELDEIADELGATTLSYLSLDGLRRAVGAGARRGLCTACLTGAPAWLEAQPRSRAAAALAIASA